MQPARCTWRSLVANAGNARTCHFWCVPETRSWSPSQRVFRAPSPIYCWPRHRLVGARVGRSPCTDPRAMVTQRGDSRRSVAHNGADLHGSRIELRRIRDHPYLTICAHEPVVRPGLREAIARQLRRAARPGRPAEAGCWRRAAVVGLPSVLSLVLSPARGASAGWRIAREISGVDKGGGPDVGSVVARSRGPAAGLAGPGRLGAGHGSHGGCGSGGAGGGTPD